MRSILRRAGPLLLIVLCGCAAAMSRAEAPTAPPMEAAATVTTEEAPGMFDGTPSARESRSRGESDGRLADNRVPPPAQPGQPAAPGKRSDAGEVSVKRGPMLIYTAQITMAVFEVNAGLTKVEELGKELGGFLAKRDDRSVTIRVPAERFDEAVRRIESVGDMVHRNVVAEDVTEEYRDLEIRLKSARAVHHRLTDLLAKAVKVEESIAIERELNRVSTEIERLEGRAKYLRDRAAFSTITVTFDAKPKERVGGGEVRLPVGWLRDLGLRRLLSL